MSDSTGVLADLLQSKRQLRAETRRLDLHQLTELVQVLSDALAREQEKSNKQAEKARLSAIEKINTMLKENGIAPDELITGDGRKAGTKGKKGRPKAKKAKAGAKKAPIPAKYRLVIDGEEFLWSGRGRPPRVFQDYIAAGNSKESCAI